MIQYKAETKATFSDDNGNKIVTERINPHRRYPINGHKAQVYMKRSRESHMKSNHNYPRSLEEAALLLNKTELLMLLNITVDNRGIIRKKWNRIAEDMPIEKKSASYISKIKRGLENKGFILKYNKMYMLNPYVVLPQYDKDDVNAQYEAQRIWTHLTEDKDAGFEGMEEVIEKIFKLTGTIK